MFDLDPSEIAIVSSTDEGFIPHLATLFLSLLETKHPDTALNFYVIDDDISLQSKEALNRMVNDYGSSISYLQIQTVEFDDMVESDRIPTTAYYRISIPNYLKRTDIRRAVYLDCDIIALKSIEDIWLTDLGDYLLAAAEDAGFHHRLEDMNIESDSMVYFNSGMMIIDVEKWREEKIPEQVINFAEYHKENLRFHDQDALNAVLHDRWKMLHPKWNAQQYMLLDEKEHPTEEGKLQFEEARRDPALVHFSGHIKPWHKESDHPYQEKYLEIRSRTPFPAENELESGEQ